MKQSHHSFLLTVLLTIIRMISTSLIPTFGHNSWIYKKKTVAKYYIQIKLEKLPWPTLIQQAALYYWTWKKVSVLLSIRITLSTIKAALQCVFTCVWTDQMNQRRLQHHLFSTHYVIATDQIVNQGVNQSDWLLWKVSNFFGLVSFKVIQISSFSPLKCFWSLLWQANLHVLWS